LIVTSNDDNIVVTRYTEWSVNRPLPSTGHINNYWNYNTLSNY